MQDIERGERQKHGFKYEEDIINKYKLEEDEGYTSKWDAYYKGIPVSIKTKKIGNAVEMGDIFRNADREYSFIMFVGFWDWNENKEKVLVEEHILYINKNFWEKQFDEESMKVLEGAFDGITNSYSDDEKWKERMGNLKDMWKSKPSIINMHLKRDHKTQKRIQCSIKNKDFYGTLVKYYSIDSLDEIFKKNY